jgi:hypothetical protein
LCTSESILEAVFYSFKNVEISLDLEKYIIFIVEDIFIEQLKHLDQNEVASSSMHATIRLFVSDLIHTAGDGSHEKSLSSKIENFIKEPILIPTSKTLGPPDGSSIGNMDNSIEFIAVQCTSFH